MAKNNKTAPGTVAVNRRARHEYTLEDKFEAGLVLHGWEVKSIRAGKVNIAEGFIQVKNGEAWLHNSIITPLLTASTHVEAQPNRIRKLLLNKREIVRLVGAVERQGYTLVPTTLYWLKGKLKLALYLAKGKNLHDKRRTEKDRDWQREKARAMKGSLR